MVFADGDLVDLEARRQLLADAVMGSGVGVDVMTCSVREFEDYGQTAGSLIRTVHEQGREVYVSRAERRRRQQIQASAE